MKSTSAAFAILSVMIFLDSCSSAPSLPATPAVPTLDNVQKIAEGGSSQDTLNIKLDDNESAYVFETFTAEGKPKPETLYVKPGTRARFYKILDYKLKKK